MKVKIVNDPEAELVEAFGPVVAEGDESILIETDVDVEGSPATLVARWMGSYWAVRTPSGSPIKTRREGEPD